jgi:hypothetical protein
MQDPKVLLRCKQRLFQMYYDEVGPLPWGASSYSYKKVRSRLVRLVTAIVLQHGPPRQDKCVASGIQQTRLLAE